MKKFLSLFALVCMTFIASAQTPINPAITAAYPLVGGDYGNTVDTINNTETVTKFLKVTGSYQDMSIQVVITKISGTVGGTVTLVASNDGTNFVDICKPSIAISSLRPAYKDTLTPTNVTTNTKIWNLGNASRIVNNIDGTDLTYTPYLYYGLKYVGTGTMSATFKAYLVPRH